MAEDWMALDAKYARHEAELADSYAALMVFEPRDAKAVRLAQLMMEAATARSEYATALIKSALELEDLRDQIADFLTGWKEAEAGEMMSDEVSERFDSALRAFAKFVNPGAAHEIPF